MHLGVSCMCRLLEIKAFVGKHLPGMDDILEREKAVANGDEALPKGGQGGHIFKLIHSFNLYATFLLHCLAQSSLEHIKQQ